jgi:hypothetical protein
VRKIVESVQTAINVELEAMVKSQGEKITELEAAYADLKHEKESIMLAEAHAIEATKIQGELNVETRSYADYHMNVHRCLHGLHELVASSFDEVKAR